jgi:hypothetical protein
MHNYLQSRRLLSTPIRTVVVLQGVDGGVRKEKSDLVIDLGFREEA